MQKTITLALVVILSLFLLVACSSEKKNPSGSDTEQHVTESTGNTPSQSLSDIADIGHSELAVTPKSVSNQYKSDGDVLISYSVNCPILAGSGEYNLEKINQTLNLYCESYTTIANSEKNAAKEDYDTAKADDIEWEPYEKTADYTAYVRENILSIRFESYEQSGGADSLWLTTALCFDLVSGEQLSFADYIGKNEEYAKNYIVSAFTVIINTDPENYFDDALSLLPNEITGASYYLSEEGVTLFLNTNSIAPSALGTQTIIIPYSNLPK